MKKSLPQFDFSSRTQVMGILNCTPDSFFDGGRYEGPQALIQRGLNLIEEGADWLDIGGESSRPGATPVSTQEEMDRVLPVIEGLRKQTDIPISIDTTKATVARSALKAGAVMVNDVSGLRNDPEIITVARDEGAYLLIMHSRGTPQTMQSLARYTDVVKEVVSELKLMVQTARESGISQDRLLVDPGIGFAKNKEQNLELLRNLKAFHCLGSPLVLGVSRKKFIGEVLGRENPEDRLFGSLALAFYGATQGVALVRVHDVKATCDVIRMGRLLQPNKPVER